MAAVFLGLLAAVLQISGAFSVHYLDGHDFSGRPWLKQPPFQAWEDRKFGNSPHFHVDPRRRFSNTEQNFDYQLFPLNWASNNKGSEKFISLPGLGNPLSSDSRITSSRLRLERMKHLRTLPKESRKELYPKLFLKSLPIVLNTSSLRSSTPKDKMDKSNIERPAVLYQKDMPYKSDSKDNDFIVKTLHVTTSIDEEENENLTTVPEAKKENTDAEDGTRKHTLVEKEASKSSTVHEETKANTVVEDETSNNKSAQEEKKNLDVKEIATLVEEETTETTPVVEENADGEVLNQTIIQKGRNETASVQKVNEENIDAKDEMSNQTLLERERNETTSVQEEKETNTDVDDETSNTTMEVISKNTSDNTSATKETLHTNSQTAFTKVMLGSSLEDTTETVHGSITSISNETTPPVNDSTSEATHMSSSDSSNSEVVSTTVKIPVSTKDVTDAPVSQTLSSEISDASSEDASPAYISTESKSSKSEFVTEATSVTPEHVIEIPSIRKAKVVISVVFLVIGLIAVAVLAVYMFRERRKTVKYDQLQLLS